MIEILKFKVTLNSTGWDKKPEYQILIGDALVANGTVGGNLIDEIFEIDLKEGDYTLKVQLCNKDETDTVQDESGNIVKDMLLHIKGLQIDDIDMGPWLWSNSKFTLDTPVEYPPGNIISEYVNCVDLGHNGVWEFKFKSPMYEWLLDIL